MPYESAIDPLLATCARQPDRLAVVWEGHELTYREFLGNVHRCARVLKEDLGIKVGDKVAYFLPNSRAILEVFYAIQEIGAVAVPINCRHIAREVAYLVRASDSKALIYCYRFAEKVSQACESMGYSIGLLQSAETDEGRLQESNTAGLSDVPILEVLMETKSAASIDVVHDPEALSRIQYTGGSTGLPKGASRTHRADLVELAGVLDSNGFTEHEDSAVVLIQCPLEHHGGHSWFTAGFAVGATLVICGAFDEESILQKIQTYGVTHMILLPPVTYLRLLAWEGIGDYDLSSVRLVQSAAGAVNPKVLKAVFNRFPNADFNYGWGQSESGLGTSNRVTRKMYECEDLSNLSIGKPMLGLEMMLVDDSGNEVGMNEPGEAVVRGGSLMSGYYGQPELDESIFLDDGWMRTGDVMKKDGDGNYFVQAREKDVIKSGGENVFVSEVELVINSHPAVQDCMVFGTSDLVMGEAVAAVVQLLPGKTLTGKELQDHCKRYISSYKKPRYILFVDSLGKDDAGKVRKSCVVEMFDAHKSEAKVN